MKLRLAAAAAAFGVLAAGPASANNVLTQTAVTIFSQCDGFGMPASGGDGMTGYAMIWGVFNPPGYGTTAKSGSASGAAGVAACDQALADEHLKPEYWMRRVNLLRARALHQLERGDTAAALADLDRADAAVQDPNDPFYQRSLGLGVKLVRAYALRRSGETARGLEMAKAAAAERPYTRMSSYSALVAMGPAADQPEGEAVVRSLARLQPSAVNDIFADLFDQGRWSELAAVYPQLATPQRRASQSLGYGGTWDYDYIDRVEAEVFWAQHAGAYAYALATLGRGQEARAVLDKARARVAKAAEPEPAPTVVLRKTTMASAERAQKRKLAEAEKLAKLHAAQSERIRVQGVQALDGWAKIVERRLAIADGHADEVLKSLATEPLPRGSVGVDMVEALAAKIPASDKAGQAAVAGLKGKLVSRKRASEPSVSQLFKTLPDAETVKRLTPYKVKNTSFWTGSENGFTTAALENPEAWGVTDAGVVSVTFRGVASPAAVVEEMAMLRAADLARSSGKRGFVIVNRRDIEHSVVTTQYGVPLRSDPSGYETRLDILLVDPDALPEKYRDAPWRVVDAEAVYAALAPIYIRPEAPKQGRKKG